eukprot:5810832-Pyramimonas_sp.AAC.2
MHARAVEGPRPGAVGTHRVPPLRGSCSCPSGPRARPRAGRTLTRSCRDVKGMKSSDVKGVGG